MKKKLVLMREDGILPNGKKKYKRVTFSNIILTADKESLKKVAKAIDDLCKQNYVTTTLVTEEDLD